jgi:menaquinone-dependent protoporphyrinogen IX oxidase
VDDMSENKILIAYATRGGPTEDYAKAIGSVLTDEFKMHKEGAEFLEKTDFGDRKVVIFLSSLVPRDEAIKKYVDVIVQKNTKLKPLAVEVFGGRMRILGRTTQDRTDMEKAKAWARKIAEQLKADHMLGLITWLHFWISVSAQSARIRLFLALCSTSANPKASRIGGK